MPARCGRRLKLSGIESEWASIGLDPALLDDEALGPNARRSLDHATFSNIEDRFLAGVAASLAQTSALDGGVDPLKGEEMSLVLTRYLLHRYGRVSAEAAARPWRLPLWRLRRISDYVESHLDGEIRIADLADAIGVSSGYLHRAFRDSTGQTPLEFVNERRVRYAQQVLENEPASMVEIALRIGFQSPSHFTRIFRAVTGTSPSRYRALVAR